MLLSDLASIFGLSYSPAPAPQAISPAPAPSALDDAKGLTALRLVAGEWLCRSLPHQQVVSGSPAALLATQLLVMMRDFGGSMRGRPFEMLCAQALCFRSLLRAPETSLAELVPHLGCSMRGKDVAPRLSVVALPKAVTWKKKPAAAANGQQQRGAAAADDEPQQQHSAAAARGKKNLKRRSATAGGHQHPTQQPPDDTGKAPRLTDAQKAMLMNSQQRWTGKDVIAVEDVPWLLSNWLLPGCMGVPADAQSGSQDFFLRLSGGVMGFALKAASPTAGTGWVDLRDELRKAPVLPDGVPYTLVLWSLHLAPQVSNAIGTAEVKVFAPGRWLLSGNQLRHEPPCSDAPVPAGSSPTGAVGDGLPATAGNNSAGARAAPAAAIVPKSKVVFEVRPGTELLVVNPSPSTRAGGGGGLRELLGDAVVNSLQRMVREGEGLTIKHLEEWMPRSLSAAGTLATPPAAAAPAVGDQQ